MGDWGEAVQKFGILYVELLVLFAAIAFAVAIVQRRIGDERLAELLSSRSRIVGLLKGSLLGAVTPFCACTTIPVMVGLVQAKVRFATVAAFLLASPLLNPIVLGAVALLFGPRVALIYGGVAFGFTLVAAALWDRAGLQQDVKRVRVVRPVAAASVVPVGGQQGADPPWQGEGGCSVDGPAPWLGLRRESPEAWQAARSLLRKMLVPMTIGVTVGALVYGAVPPDTLVRLAGPENPAAILVAAVAGIPLYVRALTALPIGSGLLEAGVGLGPIFALVIGGAGASVPMIAMLTATFKPRLVVIFVLTILTVAVVGGYTIGRLA